MECDIILKLGDGYEFKISKESSSEELDSLEKIVEFLKTLPEYKTNDLFDRLARTVSKINANDQFFLNHQLISNCTFDNLLIRYPKETELIKDLKLPYNITLIDKAYSNGEELKGRVVINGVVSYIFRDRFDVQNFAMTEHKKQLAEKNINEDEISDPYLSDKYLDLLKKIKTAYKENSIKDLVINYLNNVSKYTKILDKTSTHPIDSASILQDFCKELNNEQVFNTDTETDFARHLRRLHYKRTNFGKLEFYEALSTYFPEFSKEYTKQQFVELNAEELNDAIQKYFQDDLIMSKYKVVKADTTRLEDIKLSKKQEKELFEKVLESKNEQRKALKQSPLSKDQEFSSLEEIESFYKGYDKIEVDGKIFPIKITQNSKGNFVFSYRDKRITNNDKIKLEQFKNTLGEQFNFGYDTIDIFQPVNVDGVKDGQYQGYYIYEHIPENKEPIYLVSQSVISPSLYGINQFGSIKDAKNAIEGYNRSSNLEKATKIGLKQRGSKRHINLGFRTYTGQTIDSIDYPINPSVKVQGQEYKLLSTGTIAEVQEEYRKKYKIDISSLTLPEQVGTFIYAMVEKGYPITKLQQYTLSEDDFNKINTIIEDIKNSKIKQYLVERSIKIEDGKYTTYLKSLTDSGITVNSTGKGPSDIDPTSSITSTLFNLKNVLEKTILKGSGIQIKVVDNDTLLSMSDSEGNKLFDNINGIRAFVYDNNIYINQSNASLGDMLHETLHIVLGAIRAQDMQNGTRNYLNILDFYNTKKIPVKYKYRKDIEQNYKNLAYIDKIEELVVKYISRQIENGDYFYYDDQTTGAVRDFAKLFLDLEASIRDTLKESFDTDMGFMSNIQSLISGNIPQMQKNRIITNLIEKGIEKGVILEDCK